MTYRWPIFNGDRVAIAPHLDLFMRGVRYGMVETIHDDEGAPRRYLVQYAPGDAIWLLAEDLLGAVNARPGGGGADVEGASPSTCSSCGAVLVNEDCPNYGNGPEHAPMREG